MSSRPAPKISDFDLVALRSDQFIDARRKADQERFLLRKIAPEGGISEEVRAQFQKDSVRAGAFCGNGVLELVSAFEDEGALYFAMPFFEGRTLAVQLARGRKFTFAESWEIAVKIARALERQKVSHGAVAVSNVLTDDGGEVRVAPALHARPVAEEPGIATDLRSLALLVGHLILGSSPISPDAEGRALTAWTMRPEVPGQYRTLLARMLGAGGNAPYKSWADCLRDMQLPASRPVATAPRQNSSAGLVLCAVLALAAGGWWFLHRTSIDGSHQKADSAAAPKVAAKTSPDLSENANVAKQPAPAEQPAENEAAGEIDYTRLMAVAMKSAASRDYRGAIAGLQQWLAAHGANPFSQQVDGQIGRLQLAEAAYESLSSNAADLIGATIEVPDKTQGVVTKIDNSHIEVTVRTQFGSVTKTVDAAALSDATVAALLARSDARKGENSTAAFLLGGTHIPEARGTLKDGEKDADLKLWADDWEKLARNNAALAALDRVNTLMSTNDTASAAAALQQIRATYGDSSIVTGAMSEQIYRWEQQLASAKGPSVAMTQTQKTDYPGLPKLTLSSSIPIGDPDFKQLGATTRWVIEHGNWREHREALDKALVAAAGMGNWTQYSGNLERILSLKTASVMLSQDAALHAMDPSVIKDLPKDKDTTEFLNWLFTNPRAIELLAATLKPQDKPKRVLEIWRDCWKSDREGAEKYMALALAVAVDFDDAIAITPGFFGTKDASYSGEAEHSNHVDVNPVDRYKFYRDADTHGMLKVALGDLEPYELVWVVDAPVPTSELVWAQKNVHLSRKDWGKAYFSIRYRMDKAAGGVEIYDYYTLAEIKERGGICGDQAYFAAMTAKANGIPAMVISGQGDRGGHAWVQWEATKNGWEEAGRYADNYAAGTTNEPQTHRTVKEQELHEVTAPQRRTDGWELTERYLKLSTLLANAKQPELARVALDAAVQATPQHEGAWYRFLDSLIAAKVSTEEWEKQIARMRVAFQKFPDIIQEINKRETDYLSSSGDAKAALAAVERQGDRFMRKDKSRTDLILDSVYKEVELAEKAGDPAKVGKIYRDALREKGKEVVAFKSLAPKYYDWAKGQQQGVQALHEIDQTFEHNFKPTGDYFALGAYHDSLALVISLYKKEGLEADVHRLERISDKVEDKRQDIGDQSKRNARDK